MGQIFQKMGHLGSRYIYIYRCSSILKTSALFQVFQCRTVVFSLRLLVETLLNHLLKHGNGVEIVAEDKHLLTCWDENAIIRNLDLLKVVVSANGKWVVWGPVV